MAAYEKFAKYYDRLMYDCDYDSWSQYLLNILAKHCKAGCGIDFACGSGKITAALARAGYRVRGVDLSESMLNEAIANCAPYMRRVTLARGNMCSFRETAPQDFITCCCDGVNYLHPARQFPAFVKNCRRNLKPGGLLLFDVSSDYKLEKVIGNNIFADDSESVTYLWQNDLSEEGVDMQLIFFVKENGAYSKFTEQHTLYRYLPEHIESVLVGSGFSNVQIWGHGTQDPPGPSETRLQICAVRKE